VQYSRTHQSLARICCADPHCPELDGYVMPRVRAAFSSVYPTISDSFELGCVLGVRFLYLVRFSCSPIRQLYTVTCPRQVNARVLTRFT